MSFSCHVSFQNAAVNKMETYFSLKANYSVSTVHFYNYLSYYSESTPVGHPNYSCLYPTKIVLS